MSKIQSRFSIADLLILLAAIIFGYFSFLSFNFQTLGNNFNGNIIKAVVITVILAVLAFGIKMAKQTNRKFKTFLLVEIVLFIVFTVLIAIFTKTSFSHYFNVVENKKEIQSDLENEIKQAKNMFVAYEKYANHRISNYEEKLKNVVRAKRSKSNDYNAYGFTKNISDEKQIDNMMFAIKADLFPSNYQNIKKVSTEWLDESNEVISKWKSVGVVNIVNTVNTKSNDWLNDLAILSTVREKNEKAEDFDYTLSFKSIKGQFKEKKQPNNKSIGISFLLYILMLLSWMITRRSTKYPGIRFLLNGNVECKGSEDVGEVEL